VRVLRASTSVALVVGVALAFTHPVHAEPIDNGSGTVQVQPVTSYPVVTQGSAGYGSAGITANAQASSSAGSGGTGHGGYYYGPVYTYTPIPQGQVVVPGSVQINSERSNREAHRALGSQPARRARPATTSTTVAATTSVLFACRPLQADQQAARCRRPANWRSRLATISRGRAWS